MPYKDKNERKYKDLCRMCPLPNVPGYVLCAKHSYKSALQRRLKRLNDPLFVIKEREGIAKVRARYVAEGGCVKCGKPLQDDEKKYCMQCKCSKRERVGGRYKRGVFYDRRTVNEAIN